MYSPKEKDEQVLAVLNAAKEPIGPTEIGRRLNQNGFDWAMHDKWPQSAPVMGSLRRIGAVRHKGGKYTAPEGE